jgi:beta-lactamase regulating signal transducer with metallopeptidase domain
MNLPDLFAPSWTTVLVNHLWQSTAVVLVAWLLTLSLRTNPARVRYAIWMIASIKFLFPFALLTSLGEHWATHNPAPQVSPSLHSARAEFLTPPPQPSLRPATQLTSRLQFSPRSGSADS